MAAINDLIAQIQDAELRNKIEQEVNRMNKQKKFGLVFEEHLPECTPLYEMPVNCGSNVALKSGNINDIYRVIAINNEKALCMKEDEKAEWNIADLVVVAKFGEPIYPYLKQIDSVCNAPGSDLWHTLIEADNYHALQLLEYLYAGKVDCIYIDPPYNTGTTYPITINDIIKITKLITDYGILNNHFPINEAIYITDIEQINGMKKKLDLVKKLVLVGNPRTGKSWLVYSTIRVRII